MKKLIICSVFAIAFAVAIALNVNSTSNQSVLPDLTLSNVEALAIGEGGNYKCYPPYYDTCEKEGDIFVPGIKG